MDAYVQECEGVGRVGERSRRDEVTGNEVTRSEWSGSALSPDRFSTSSLP